MSQGVKTQIWAIDFVSLLSFLGGAQLCTFITYLPLTFLSLTRNVSWTRMQLLLSLKLKQTQWQELQHSIFVPQAKNNYFLIRK